MRSLILQNRYAFIPYDLRNLMYSNFFIRYVCLFAHCWKLQILILYKKILYYAVMFIINKPYIVEIAISC